MSRAENDISDDTIYYTKMVSIKTDLPNTCYSFTATHIEHHQWSMGFQSKPLTWLMGIRKAVIMVKWKSKQPRSQIKK